MRLPLRQHYLKMNHFFNVIVFILYRDDKLFCVGNVCVENEKHRLETSMVGRLFLVNWHKRAGFDVNAVFSLKEVVFINLLSKISSETEFHSF